MEFDVLQDFRCVRLMFHTRRRRKFLYIRVYECRLPINYKKNTKHPTYSGNSILNVNQKSSNKQKVETNTIEDSMSTKPKSITNMSVDSN